MNARDAETYILSEHREWDGCKHGCKDTKTADTVTYKLPEDREWNR